MRLPNHTIPSSFIPLDSQTNAADSFANVYDLNTVRLNHNRLLARRVKHDLVSQLCVTDNEIGDTHGFWTFKSQLPVRVNDGPLMLHVPLYVTQWAKHIVFRCQASETALTAASTMEPGEADDEDPLIYCVVRNPSSYRMSSLSDYSITVSAAHDTPTNYSVTVPIPPGIAEPADVFGRMLMYLDVYVKCFIDYTRVDDGPFTFSDVGENWFDTDQMASATGNVNNAVYVSTDTRINVRKIIKETDLDGTVYRYHLDAPWNRIPNPNSDQIETYEILGVELYSYHVQETALTTFDESTGFEL